MYKPKNKDEYLDLVDQAIFETDDLLMSAEAEGEEDDFGAYVPIYEQLLKGLRQLHEDVQADRHAFADGADLPFMALRTSGRAGCRTTVSSKRSTTRIGAASDHVRQ